jgi:hypothetical protein
MRDLGAAWPGQRKYRHVGHGRSSLKSQGSGNCNNFVARTTTRYLGALIVSRSQLKSAVTVLGYSEAMNSPQKYPSTPDGRYFVVRGRLWRMSNPALPPDERQALVDQLMDARRQVGAAKKACDPAAEVDARAAVDAAKRGLGERGPVWWTDGAPDFNRRMVANTPYAEWYKDFEAV